MITGIEGLAWIVKPNRKLNGATARFAVAPEATGAGLRAAVGAHATPAAAAADISALRRVILASSIAALPSRYASCCFSMRDYGDRASDGQGQRGLTAHESD